MKKFVVPIIIAAVLGIGGGVTAVMMNRPAVAEKDNMIAEVKSGNYYFNGDKESGLWLEVTPEYLTLKGNDVDSAIKEAIIKLHNQDHTLSDEVIEAELEANKKLYCLNKSYICTEFLPDKSRYLLRVSRNEAYADTETLLSSNAGFVYDVSNGFVINLGLFGDFILGDD